jgi:hypothetical protein
MPSHYSSTVYSYICRHETKIGGKLDKLNKWNCLTYLGAARALGVSVWRIRYAVESGYLSAPSVVLKRRALFSPEQVEAVRGFFEVEDAVRKQTREGPRR